MIMKRRAEVKGAICICELAWRHKWVDHCPLNAPETDSEGQTTANPLPSRGFFFPDKRSRAAETDMSGLLSDLARPSVDV